MPVKFNRKTYLSLLIVVAMATSAFCAYRLLSRPSYEGANVKLSKADENTSLQIDSAVMNMQTKTKPGVQTSIQITKFAGIYAQGTISDSDQSPTQQFMAVKTGEDWKIIAHNTGKTLDLPDIHAAMQYHLPKGWYKTN